MSTILKKPLVTEKMNILGEKGQYGFIVDKNANKIDIKKAIEKMYGVKVESVRTIRYQGKEKTKYTSNKIISGRTAAYKKAIVSVAEGEVIDFYSGI